MTAQSPAQSLHKVAQRLAHTVCPPLKGDTLCALGAETLCKPEPVQSPVVSKTEQPFNSPPDDLTPIKAWARMVAPAFPSTVPGWPKLRHPDPYRYLDGAK